MISVNYSTSFWKKLFLVAVFFLITPIALTTSFANLSSIYSSNNKDPQNITPSLNLLKSPKSGVSVFAALPSDAASIDGEVLGADARVEMIRQYLNYYESPLADFADVIVKTADEFGVDYRLTTAIAQQESNLCKKIPAESYNCWGWGIHSRGTLGFISYSEGVHVVTEGLKQDYIDKGFSTVDEIMSKYTPLSPGSWAYGVTKFMNQMR